MNFYSENNPHAAEWLRNLIAANLIPDGDVDERSIVDVRAEDLGGYTQCHFFAGIAAWCEALKLTGWPPTRPVWTASCPCQPLSGAGQRKGHADERHLWPAFYGLVAECKPAEIFGEQVASKDGREWFAGVRADLEALGYACGAADLCAAGVGAPHIRQRLYWVAYANGGNAGTERLQRGREYGQFAEDGCSAEGLGDADGEGLQIRKRNGSIQPEAMGAPAGQAAFCGSSIDRMGDAQGKRRNGWPYHQDRRRRERPLGQTSEDVSAWNGPTIAIECTDGWRRISAKPSSFPLVNGDKGRMGRLRAYGNTILPQVGAEFITAYEEAKSSSMHGGAR